MIDEINRKHVDFEIEHFNVTATTFDEEADWKPVRVSFAHVTREPNTGIDCYYDLNMSVALTRQLIKALQLAVDLADFRG